MIGFEVEGFDKLQAAVSSARKVFPQNARNAVEVTLRNIKDDARAGAAAIGGQASGMDKTIDYLKPAVNMSRVEGEVGYRKGRRRAGLPLEVGTRHTAPKPVLKQALEKNRQDFLDGLAKAVKDSFE